jgi:DNA topoisomerase-1
MRTAKGSHFVALGRRTETDKSKTKRIVFHEITKTAILKAIDNPREINYDLVNAQQARRVLDRLVGYELSPVLWRKVKGGLSAGRVQSVAVRLIVEREREIQNFKPVATYSVVAEFTNETGKTFKAKLPRNFNTKKEAEDFLHKNIGSIYKVADLETKPAKNHRQRRLRPLPCNKKRLGNCTFRWESQCNSRNGCTRPDLSLI